MIQNSIQTASLKDIYIVSNRYAIIKDTDGLYRVVSLVRHPANELLQRDTLSGISYTFDRFGNGYKNSYNQHDLKNLSRSYGKAPTGLQYQWLKERGVVTVVVDVVDVKLANTRDGFDGIPTPGHSVFELDPNKGGWIIATIAPSGTLLFSTRPKVHLTRRSAKAELDRLAEAAPGNEFVLFKAEMTAVSNTVQTKIFE
jgi:hypothetical protein